MFKKNEWKHGAVSILLAECSKLGRGDILTHERIKELTGLDPGQGVYHVIDLLKKKTRVELGQTLWPICGIGWKLMTADETLTTVPKKRMASANRHVDETIKSIASLPDEGLSENQRRLKGFQLDAARSAKQKLRSRQLAKSVAEMVAPVRPRIFGD